MRTSGLLLHPTSLPGPFGIGDFGYEARGFLNFLAASDQHAWQVLPLGPTGYGNSPYQSLSAFAGDTLLISPHVLVDEQFLTEPDIDALTLDSDDRVDYAIAQSLKDKILGRAFFKFQRQPNTRHQVEFDRFCDDTAFWLDDYALFRALKDAHEGVEWTKWPRDLANRDPLALEKWRVELSEEIRRHKFYQFLFFRQWEALRTFAHRRLIRLIGDIPLFVAHDSVDVWAHREFFKLDEAGQPTVVAGVPPDYFSDTGQLWGNPVYDWKRLEADGFKWWIERVHWTLTLFDQVRVDHFRGFAAGWEINADEQTAVNGQWIPAPGRELFAALKPELQSFPLIAENLGVITPDVESLREEFGFPGMRVLQFAFGSDDLNEHLPRNYSKDVVVYTGTHDNDTTAGWFASLSNDDLGQKERAFCLESLESDGHEIHWDFIRAAFESTADTAIIPVQDLLGLGGDARMNLPASTSGNWVWRLRDGMLTDELAARLKQLTETSGRSL